MVCVCLHVCIRMSFYLHILQVHMCILYVCVMSVSECKCVHVCLCVRLHLSFCVYFVHNALYDVCVCMCVCIYYTPVCVLMCVWVVLCGHIV